MAPLGRVISPIPLSTAAGGRAAVVLLAVLFGCTGCASTARLQAWRPAELDVPPLHRLVVLDFNSPDDSGELARSAIVADLSENRFYNLVDQSELGPVVSTATGPARGKIDLAAAIEAGRRLGIDALLTGDVVSYQVTDNAVHEHEMGLLNTPSRYPGGAAPGTFLQTTVVLNREAIVALDFRLVEVASGQICASRQIVHSYRGRQVNGRGPMPGRDEVLAQLMHQCAAGVVAKIAPHQEETEVTLASPYLGRGASKIRQDNAYAQDGQWEDAAHCYEEALAADPQSHAAQYNLALAHEARCQFAPARELLETAHARHACKLYASARQRVAQSDEAFRTACLHQQAALQSTPPRR